MSRPFLPALCALLSSGAASAQAPPPADTNSAPSEAFPFVMPWDDAAPGTATDLSGLNVRPAGAHGRIVVKDGHLAEADTGRRVRFLAVNLAAKSAFPSHADAEKVAARLAKLGVNLVRLHHLDNDWTQESTLIDLSRPDRRHILPSQRDRFDYLIAQLEKNGIYVNINLHIARTLSEADGMLPGAKQIPFSFDKRVDYFDATLIARQKEYAKDLLTHVNPYTGSPYTTDPGVMVVELTNEDSLVGDPWAKYGEGLDALPPAYRDELQGLWNDWLKKRYKTDAALKASWLKGVEPLGNSLVSGGSQWTSENQGTSKLSSDIGQPPGLGWGAAAATWTVQAVDGTDWHVQSHITGLDFQGGRTYTVTFEGKADPPRTLPVYASLDQADWHGIGLNAPAALTRDWQPFRFVFTAKDVVPKHGRLAFTLGAQTGTVQIQKLQIRTGVDTSQAIQGTLAARTIPIPGGGGSTPSQRTDWLLFLSDTEVAYADTMRTYLRKTLGLKSNLVCSQISWGGVLGLRREAGMDIADNHAYWQHPSFPHHPWDPVDWNIPNTSMVAALAKGDWNTLKDLSEYRVSGKPYTISEYNHPAPNDYQAETVPLLASFAAFQDWDAIYLFDYGDYGAGAKNDQINGFFGIASNPAKTAFLPAAALMFRQMGLPNVLQSYSLDVYPPQYAGENAAEIWKGQLGLARAYLSGRMALLPTSRMSQGFPANGLGSSELIPVHVKNEPTGAIFSIDALAANVLVGFVGGGLHTVGPVTYKLPKFGNNFAAITLTPLDGQAIPQSRRLLLTVVGKVENQGMQWNADRTSVGSQWGHGPTLAEFVPVAVGIQSKVLHHVYALDGTGKRTQEVPAVAALDGTINFTARAKYQTVWYEVTE